MLVSNSLFLGTHGTFSRNTRQNKVHNNKLQSALFICHHLWQTLMAWTRTSHLPSGSTVPSKCLDTFSSRGGAIAAITGEIMTKPHQTLTPIRAAPLYISDTLLKVCDWKQLLKRPHTHTKIPLPREGTQKKKKAADARIADLYWPSRRAAGLLEALHAVSQRAAKSLQLWTCLALSTFRPGGSD